MQSAENKLRAKIARYLDKFGPLSVIIDVGRPSNKYSICRLSNNQITDYGDLKQFNHFKMGQK